jgi:hypothetical protein
MKRRWREFFAAFWDGMLTKSIRSCCGKGKTAMVVPMQNQAVETTLEISISRAGLVCPECGRAVASTVDIRFTDECVITYCLNRNCTGEWGRQLFYDRKLWVVKGGAEARFQLRRRLHIVEVI